MRNNSCLGNIVIFGQTQILKCSDQLRIRKSHMLHKVYLQNLAAIELSGQGAAGRSVSSYLGISEMYLINNNIFTGHQFQQQPSKFHSDQSTSL